MLSIGTRSTALLTTCVGAAAAITTLNGAVAPQPAKAWKFDSSAIAHQALAYRPGRYGGQCKVFAQRVVNQVLARHRIPRRIGGYGTPGGAYYGAYETAGGMRIKPRDGRVGDLIQVIVPRHKNSDFPPTRTRRGESMLHTAIIVRRTRKPGQYVVHDSNYVAHETVGQHVWDPFPWKKHGDDVYIWRFGTNPHTGHDALPGTAPAAGPAPTRAPRPVRSQSDAAVVGPVDVRLAASVTAAPYSHGSFGGLPVTWLRNQYWPQG